MNLSQLTQKQKIIAVGLGFSLLVAAIFGIYFGFIKKDTPKTTPKPKTTPTPTPTPTPSSNAANSLPKSDKIKELEQIYEDAKTNYDVAQKTYDDAVEKYKDTPDNDVIKKEFLKGLLNVVNDANSALIRARQNFEYASK